MPSPHALDGACRIADWGVIRARGTDAAKFLQGQLTNDVLALGPSRARLAGFCSAKGRLQASFVVWQAGADEFLLACSTSLLAPTLKRLSMFVLRAQCKLSDASAEVALWGLAGGAAGSQVGDLSVWEKRDVDGAVLIRLPDAEGRVRALFAAPAGVEPPGAASAPLSLAAWRWLEVRSGVVTIEAATVDRFVPQMVNFELIGGVDFQKGCYPGQEVVARSQYRGTTKRRTFLFQGDAVASAGQDVFVAGAPGEAAGTVANAAASPEGGGSSALVELRLAAVGDGELRLGSASGPVLHRVPLPYPVAVDAEAAA
ncbi:MAG: folate-binding protein [Burkholderiales bacterium]|nr:folate-binding protein [Burkholderiales bacterium]